MTIVRATPVAYLPHAEFKIIRCSGPMIPIDEPLQLAKDVVGFVGQLER